MKTMDEKVTAAKEIHKNIQRGNEIKVRIRQIEAEHLKISAVQGMEDELVKYWRGAIEHLRKEFVSDLVSRAAGGRIPHLKLDSPAAMAFINAEQWLAAIPGLAAGVAGCMSNNEGPSKLKSLNDELLRLQQELARLAIS